MLPNAFGMGVAMIGISLPLVYHYSINHDNSNNSDTPTADRTGQETDQFCHSLRLPTPQQAQQIKILKAWKELLTKSQRQDILTAASKARSEGKVAFVERSGSSGRWQLGGNWRTTYLHSNHFIDTIIDTDQFLEKCLLEISKKANSSSPEGWNRIHDLLYTEDKQRRRRLNFRTIELHEYRRGGALPARQHYDAGSLVTIDVILRDEFEGGELNCPVYENVNDSSTLLRKEYATDFFHKAGYAILFPSHKFHNVEPVTKGKRVVLVCEIWDGDKKSCAHRCLQNHDGKDCHYDLEEHQQRQMLGTFALL